VGVHFAFPRGIIWLKGGGYVTNKELATTLHAAWLQAIATLHASPNNVDGKAIKLPNHSEMAEDIKQLAEKLSSIPSE